MVALLPVQLHVVAKVPSRVTTINDQAHVRDTDCGRISSNTASINDQTASRNTECGHAASNLSVNDPPFVADRRVRIKWCDS